MVDWKLYAWVKRSKQRQRIVKLLEEPQTPTDISEELDVHIAQVSHSLSEMQSTD
jgi:predicted transcriptional regulator